MTPEQKKQLEKLKDDLKKMNEKAKALKATASLILLCFFAQAQDTITVMSHGDFQVKLALSLDENEAAIIGLPNEKVLMAVSMLPEYFEPRVQGVVIVTLKKESSLEVLDKWLKGYFNFDLLMAMRRPTKNT